MKKTDFGKDFEWGVTICAFQNEGCPTADGKDSWSHRNIIEWFCRYVEIWINEYKDKVNNWIVMNEPMTFWDWDILKHRNEPLKIRFMVSTIPNI